jgi:hypothetical protein
MSVRCRAAKGSAIAAISRCRVGERLSEPGGTESGTKALGVLLAEDLLEIVLPARLTRRLKIDRAARVLAAECRQEVFPMTSGDTMLTSDSCSRYVSDHTIE